MTAAWGCCAAAPWRSANPGRCVPRASGPRRARRAPPSKRPRCRLTDCPQSGTGDRRPAAANARRTASSTRWSLGCSFMAATRRGRREHPRRGAGSRSSLRSSGVAPEPWRRRHAPARASDGVSAAELGADGPGRSTSTRSRRPGWCSPSGRPWSARGLTPGTLSALSARCCSTRRRRRARGRRPRRRGQGGGASGRLAGCRSSRRLCTGTRGPR